MRILVTGGTGFIGGHLLTELVSAGEHDLYSLDRYVTGRYSQVQGGSVKPVVCDLRDQFAVQRAVREIQPEYTVHLASISPQAYSYDHPNEVMDVNLMGSINLAEACLRHVPHFKQFLFASTSETYGNAPAPQSEETKQFPNSPYSVAKLAAEQYMLYLKDAYGFPVTVLHPFNTYGRKDNTHFVVERIIVQMLRGGEVRLGDPTPIRDLLYVSDHVNAYLTCLGNEKAIGELFNFATGVGVTIRELVETLRDQTGFKGEIVWNTIPPRPLDIRALIGEVSKAKRVLGWEAKVPLKKGLQMTVDYWRSHLTEA